MQRSCLKLDKPPNIAVNLFIVYKLDIWSWDLNSDFTLRDCLFRSVKLTKYADPVNTNIGTAAYDLIFAQYFH